MRLLACLLLAARVVAMEASPAATTSDPAAILAANTVAGVVRLAKRLRAETAERYDLDAAERAALYRGMPPRIRGYFSDADAEGAPVDLVAAEVVRDGAGYRLNLHFRDDWLARGGDRKHRLGGSDRRGHQASIYLSRRALVTARLELEGVVDPRAAAAAAVPYGLIQRDLNIFTEAIEAKKLRAHPWRDVRPIGLTDIEGLSVQIDVTGWWKNACDIQPCCHLVIGDDRPDAHIWLAYKELIAQVDRKRGILQMTNDAFARGMTPQQAFPAYLAMPADGDDHFSVIDLTEEGGGK